MTDDRGANEGMDRLPDLCKEGHVLIVTMGYYQVALAMAVIMRNLLSRFNPDSFTLVTPAVPGMKLRHPGARDIIIQPKPACLPKRLAYQWSRLQTPFVTRAAKRLARELNVKVIVATHQDMQCLTIAADVARSLKIPWIPYIHNMVVENFKGTKFEPRARRLQKRMFDESSSVLVMCDGIADLYRDRYGLQAVSLVHNHIEPVPEDIPEEPPLRQGFLSGAIHGLNRRAAKRLLDALNSIGCPMVITTGAPAESLAKYGICGEGVRHEFYPERSDYISALTKQGVLLTALDWIDETYETDDELTTLLPTRLIEYLAAGRPVLAHCPEDYFLARFLRKHKCGTVVGERSVEALADAINHILQDGEDIREMRRAGLRTVREEFGIEKVAAQFSEELAAVAKLEWGGKLRGRPC